MQSELSSRQLLPQAAEDRAADLQKQVAALNEGLDESAQHSAAARRRRLMASRGRGRRGRRSGTSCTAAWKLRRRPPASICRSSWPGMSRTRCRRSNCSSWRLICSASGMLQPMPSRRLQLKAEEV